MKRHFILLLCCFTISFSINRPVYKVVLSQDGYVQFLNYELAVPPLREFTMCVWIRPEGVSREQTIFSYTSKQNNVKLVRIWMEAGGTNINVNLAGTIISTVPIGLKNKVWRHICISYQSDYGTWAFYVDGRLLTCEATLSLLGVILPGGGVMRFGYGNNDEGESCGFSGEMYGINMLLSSTIERNHSKVVPATKPVAPKNKKVTLLDESNEGQMKTSQAHLVKEKRNQNKINFMKSLDARRKLVSTSEDDEIKKHLESIALPFYVRSNNRYNLESNSMYQLPNERESRQKNLKNSAVSDLRPNNFIVLSRATDNEANSNKNKEIEIADLSPPPPPIKPFIFKLENDPMEISDFEVPPPVQNDDQVYGHWNGANFAQDVLQHLKDRNKVNLGNNYKYDSHLIPPTREPPPIDSFPYASEIYKKIARLRTLKKSYNKVTHISKREAQRNVEILEHDWRQSILNDHALTKPRNVHLTFRGSKPNKNQMEQNLYNSKESFEADVPDENRYSGLRQHSFQYQTKEKSPFDIRLENILNSNHGLPKPRLYDVRLEMGSDEREKVGGEENHKRRSPNSNNKNYEINSEPLVEYEGETLEASKVYRNNSSDDYWLLIEPDQKPSSTDASNFDKAVKVGNALNEKSVFQLNKENKRKSFEGGHDRIPGIETYRSDIDNEKNNVPSSLLPRVCKNVEYQDRVLFVQPDGSVNMYGVSTSQHVKNNAIEFILHNYRQCSFVESSWTTNPNIFINWEKTPVQLFGGAKARKTVDLCGFF